MKLDFKRLNTILEAKAGRAIDRLDGLKCYTQEFQDTLDAIVYLLDTSKRLDIYDTECPDCKQQKEQVKPKVSDRPSPGDLVGQNYNPLDGAFVGKKHAVLFYSNHCEPCQYLVPILDEYVATHNILLEKILLDEEPGTLQAEIHQVQGWPTIFVVEHDKVINVMVGADMNAPKDATIIRLNTEIGNFFN